jgi:hypothetical protein
VPRGQLHPVTIRFARRCTAPALRTVEQRPTRTASRERAFGTSPHRRGRTASTRARCRRGRRAGRPGNITP